MVKKIVLIGLLVMMSEVMEVKTIELTREQKQSLWDTLIKIMNINTDRRMQLLNNLHLKIESEIYNKSLPEALKIVTQYYDEASQTLNPIQIVRNTANTALVNEFTKLSSNGQAKNKILGTPCTKLINAANSINREKTSILKTNLTDLQKYFTKTTYDENTGNTNNDTITSLIEKINTNIGIISQYLMSNVNPANTKKKPAFDSAVTNLQTLLNPFKDVCVTYNNKNQEYLVALDNKNAINILLEKVTSASPQLVTFRVYGSNNLHAITGNEGKIIREIKEKTGIAAIEIEMDGLVKIFGQPGQGIDLATMWVKTLAGQINKGMIFEGIVRRIEDFGIFVELVPGKDGLIHVSEVPGELQHTIREKFPLGSTVKVKVINYNAERDDIRLGFAE